MEITLIDPDGVVIYAPEGGWREDDPEALEDHHDDWPEPSGDASHNSDSVESPVIRGFQTPSKGFMGG